jgi:RNA polymerase sigma factor (sigma-70 family)
MVYDHVTAEAIAEDAVVRALERLEVDRPTNFMAWLFQIARNLCRHFIRDRKATQRMLENQSRRNARSAFADAITREALQVFDVEFQRLTPRQRRVFLMRIIDRLSFREIGQKMELRPGAARAVFHRAKERLGTWLGYMRVL